MDIRKYLRTVPHAGYVLLAQLDESGEVIASSWDDPKSPDAVAASLTQLGIPARLLTFSTRYCVEILPTEVR